MFYILLHVLLLRTLLICCVVLCLLSKARARARASCLASCKMKHVDCFHRLICHTKHQLDKENTTKSHCTQATSLMFFLQHKLHVYYYSYTQFLQCRCFSKLWGCYHHYGIPVYHTKFIACPKILSLCILGVYVYVCMFIIMFIMRWHTAECSYIYILF